MTYDKWKTTNPADAELGNAEQAMITMREKILAALEKAPEGLTSRQLAKALHLPLNNISSCASRMHTYGKLDRGSVREVSTVEHEAILWKAKRR